MTTIGVILALILLDGIAQWVAIGVLLVFEAFEIAIWLRWRKRRSMTGSEGMLGMTGVVISDCRPAGQVNVKGQLWNALCAEGASTGEKVRVTGVDGLRLTVARAGHRSDGYLEPSSKGP